MRSIIEPGWQQVAQSAGHLLYNSVMRRDETDFREDEPCRRFVLPTRGQVGWWLDQIRDECPITAGKIQAAARFFEREHPLRADYALEHAPGLVIGIVEAKRTRRNAGDGIEQAKRYATLLDVPFAYATNGSMI